MDEGWAFIALILILGGFGLFHLALLWMAKKKSHHEVVFVTLIGAILAGIGFFGWYAESRADGYAHALIQPPRDGGKTALEVNEVYWKVCSAYLRADEWVTIIRTRAGKEMHYSFPSDVPPVFVRKTGVDGRPLYEPIAAVTVSGERNPEEPAVSPKTP